MRVSLRPAAAAVALSSLLLLAWLASQWCAVHEAQPTTSTPLVPYGQRMPMAEPGADHVHGPADAPDPIEIDPVRLERFIDKVIEEQRRRYGLPGAAVTIVDGEDVLLSKGFGHADGTGQRPVDAAQTVFDVGLISQLVTAAAVLQQVDAGALELDRNVDEYLQGFAVEAGPPVTLRDLLAQASGLDTPSQSGGYLVRRPEEALPLGEYLRLHPPRRVRPPREAIAWNATDYALAGHVVERATGLPFADAVAAGILEPLGMEGSSFVRPDELRRRMARGHIWRPSGLVPNRIEYYSHLVPVGGLVATSADIGRFMSMLLQGGTLGGRRVLSPEAVEVMTTRQFTHHPKMHGNSLGFIETRWKGHRVLHSFDLTFMGFSSHMLLLPDDGIGLFVAYNAEAYHHVRPQLDHVFLAEILGRNPGDYDPWAARTRRVATAEDVSKYAGYYRHNGYHHRGFNKSNLLMFGHEAQLLVTPEGGLIESHRSGPGFSPVEPGLFRAGSQYLTFREQNGRVTDAQTAHRVFERVPWHQTVKVQRMALLACLLLMASGLLAWVEGYSTRRRVSAALDDDGTRPDATTRAWNAAAAPSALLLGFFVGLFVMGQMLDPVRALFDGYPTALYVLLGLPVLAAPLIARAALHAIRAWIGGTSSGVPRMHLSLVVVAQVFAVWFLHNWNMLGWNL